MHQTTIFHYLSILYALNNSFNLIPCALYSQLQIIFKIKGNIAPLLFSEFQTKKYGIPWKFQFPAVKKVNIVPEYYFETA